MSLFKKFDGKELRKARASLAKAGSKQRRSIQLSGNRIVEPRAKEAIRQVMFNASEKKEAVAYRAQSQLTTASAVVDLINGVAEGDSEVTRDGKEIYMQGLTVNVMINADSTNTTRPVHGYWAVVLDRQSNGVAMTSTQLYDDATTVLDQAIAPRNNANLERFQVLMRKDFVVGPVGGGTSGQKWQEYISMKSVLKEQKDQRVRYSGATNGIASVRTNGLFLVCCVSSQTVFANTNSAYLSYGTKLAFTDN